MSDYNLSHNISAIVLAAGLSTRMNYPKLVLPWGDRTIIEQVIINLRQADINDIWVVTGGNFNEISGVLKALSVKTAYNPRYKEDSMLLSLQVGLSGLSDTVHAAMVVLGDQPQIEAQVVLNIKSVYYETHSPLVVPSYNMRRGHPWILDRSLWEEVKALQPPRTLRDFLDANSAKIYYLSVESDSILRDLDTPKDYARELELRQRSLLDLPPEPNG